MKDGKTLKDFYTPDEYKKIEIFFNDTLHMPFAMFQKAKHEPGKTFACLGLDGTRKTKQHDNFQRDWPNIIVADERTIKAVDEKWNDLGIGEFIASPSLKFKDQMYGEEAVVQ